VRPRHKCGFDLISDALPFGGLWYDGPEAVANPIAYAQHRSRSYHAVIRIFDGAGNMGSRRTSTRASSKSGDYSRLGGHFFKNRAKSVSVIRQPKSVFSRKLLDLCLPILLI
jgi:hypothetical protein